MTLVSFPSSVIIVGAGVFGLSTALEISRKYPSTQVTIIDRQTLPAADGTSVDTSRIIRPDYVDEPYEILADRAQAIIKHDPELQPHYFENGFTFAVNGQKGELNTLWENMIENIKQKHPQSKWAELHTPEEVFQNIHGKNACLTPESKLGHKRQWNKGYTSKRCATVNAEAMVRVYYHRACGRPSVKFVLGVAVDRLLYGSSNDVLGVILEDGREFRSPKTIIATGAWSSRLVNVNGIMHANAVPIAYIRLTDEEVVKYGSMGCHTQLNLGVNVFTPIGGLLKVLRRSAGVRNTTELKDPEDASKKYKASFPITKVDNPDLGIPASAEKDIREALREIFPAVADRPFECTKICWLEQTTNGEFLICPHPKFANLHIATGGSLHGWKFLPLLGEFVVDSINDTLPPVLKQKWSWQSKQGAKLGRFGFMVDGKERELQHLLAMPAKL